jgi:hypothetical protein
MTPTTPTAAGVSVEATVKDLMDRVHFAGLARCKLSHAMENNRPAIEIAQDHQAACKLLEDAIRAALLASSAGGGELLASAKLLHNLTLGDPTVLVRAPSAEKRDAITAAGERFRAAVAAPPPPVGELQGVSDEEVRAALRIIESDGYASHTLVRRALESFAASRPVAVEVSADSEVQLPVMWRRPWNGDESDWGTYVYANDESEMDDEGVWQPLFTGPMTPQQKEEFSNYIASLAQLASTTKAGGAS